MLHRRRLNILIPIFLMTSLLLSAAGQDRVLIAYFTWAENTEIIDRDKAIRDANSHIFSVERGSGLDATTTASVIPPGNTTQLARWIGEATGGDLYSIQVAEPYSCYWDACLDRAYLEERRNERPELLGNVGNMEAYDVVFLGFPTWWYTIPMAVAHFVESHDLSGKTVIPFVTHGTSGTARTIRDLARLLPRSVMLEEEIGIYRSQMGSARPQVEAWLEEIGYDT